LLLYAAAQLAGVEPSEARIELRNWGETDPQGRALIKAAILVQQVIGLLIPIALFWLAYLVVRSPWLALLVSLVYMLDLPSVSYQFVLLPETLAQLLVVTMLCLAAWTLREPSWRKVVALAITTGLGVWTKAALLVLVPGIALVTVLADWTRWRVGLRHGLVYVAVVACFPLFWALANHHERGRFFYTKNLSITLQNYSARHFAAMDIDDPRLAVLQDHVRKALQTSPYYAVKRAYPETAAALGLRDNFQMYLFADQVNHLVLRRTWPQFLREALARNGQAWSDRFLDVKNIYVTRELSALCNRDVRRYNRLLLGRHAGAALLALVALTIALHRRDRLLINILLFFYLCAVVFVFAAAALDHTCPR
jgi:hypothetical protein